MNVHYAGEYYDAMTKHNKHKMDYEKDGTKINFIMMLEAESEVIRLHRLLYETP